MSTIAISPEGKAYPCIDALGSPLVEMGDVTQESILEIWRKSDWNLFRGGLNYQDLRYCTKCPWFSSCGYKNCRAYPAAALGKLFAPKPECVTHHTELAAAAL